MSERESGGLSPALITAIGAFVTALAGAYVAIREPSAQKVSAASEQISKANQDEHDQLVKLIQAVDDLSKNVDQNRSAADALRTYVDANFTDIRHALDRSGAPSATSPAVSQPPPAAPPPRPVSLPQPLARPPIWNAATNTLMP